MIEAVRRPALVGFVVGAAGFGAVDGYLIWETVAAGAAGALVGGVIGAAMVAMAIRPRPFDATSPRAEPAHASHYMAVWGALFVLTALEVTVAFVALSPTAIVVALLALAVWKAVLVAMYYMHLKFEPRRLWMLAVSPLPLAVILVWTVLYEGW